jgi:cobalt/nickel transport protein
MEKIYIAGIIAIIAIFILPFIINPTAKFAGADDSGSKAITQNSPDYKPWFSPIWVPPAETASMLFALQAAIGGIIIGYFIGQNKVEK